MSDASRHVVLVGMPGSGKSAVADRLGALLATGVTDLDAAIEAAEGVGVPDLFSARGEAWFREAEAGALAATLAGPPAVVATGGGVLVAASNRAALTRGENVAVWLVARLDTLRSRLAADATKRPLLAGDDATLERLERERRPLYRRVADLVVATDDSTPDDVAAEIAFRLGIER